MKKHAWPQLLHEYLASAKSREFSYGVFDCALFCADWVAIATNVDYAAPLRGYDSMAAAYKIIASYGSIENMVTALLGRPTIHPAFAQRGDIVLLRDHPTLQGAPEGLGICEGINSWFPQKTGLLTVRTLEMSAAWKIE